ncbi:hypothetical protein APA_4264 [Pseudanabaena sp. lw0831]|uniref:hypothetical protein n=1 Tax=Pseudanabaena sp. lw0831 TaxID=1357935 RepID=UPI001916B79F|nr:hypothetical protein [Pseudanabaena sp. lw0831]GBO56058.1 hypothetical protein APA_4264 [Pseudanabaena sp. lw0831]
METKVNNQAAISVPTNSNSSTNQQQQFYFDPYSPFWILVGLAILFGQVNPKRKK